MASFLEKKYLDNNTLDWYVFHDLTHQIYRSCHKLH